MSKFEREAKEVRSFVKEYWNVYAEEKDDSQKYKYDDPDDVLGFSGYGCAHSSKSFSVFLNCLINSF
ncbi:MAG: hypothetical protein OXC30_01090 [Alphaproteobacteria bacterium]|nr:hypothetical protein [Alphaproteobacteria bacterium]